MKTLTPQEQYEDAKSRRRQKFSEQEEQQTGPNGDRKPPSLLPPPSAPMQVAQAFVEQCCLDGDGHKTLHYWRGGWWVWQGSYWIEREPRHTRALLYRFTEHAVFVKGKGDLAPWDPNRKKISDVLDALAAIVILPDEISQPCWLDRRRTGTIVATANGLLDITTEELHEHTPLYFNQTAVPFDYNPRAPAPTEFLSFLGKLWPDEPQAIDVCGEWYGYVISGRLDLHKIFMTVGPTRGGKGVLARILTALLGKENVCGPTLHSLGGEFGLAPLLGKSLAIISDARFVGKNGDIVVERLLSISGEDTLTVNRKYKDQWTGKLPSRLHIISNELPRLGDASEAVIGRIVLLPLKHSWLGREDHTLEGRLLPELPRILNWALAGLVRLTIENKNRFTYLQSAEEAITAMRDLASPVAAFVREQCNVGPNLQIDVDALYSSYKVWCDHNEHSKSSKAIFGRDLRAAIPTVRKMRPRPGGRDRSAVYEGIDLRWRDDKAEDEGLL